MESKERIIEVDRIEEAGALLALARYVLRVSRGEPLDDGESKGLEHLLENVQAVIG